MEANVDPQPRGPDWMPITPKTGSLFHAGSQAEHCDDPLQAGTMSIADINKLMGELEMARNYLQSEGERVRQMMARYTHLAETASASVKIIAESLGKWRNSDKLPDLVMPHTSAPDLSPVDDDNAADGHEKTATSHG